MPSRSPHRPPSFPNLTPLIVGFAFAALAAAAQPPATPTQPEYTPDGKRILPGPKGKKLAFPLDLYDERADGAQQIREGVARAAKDNRRVLVMWGENQCGFCSELNDLLEWEDPRLRSLVASDYELVKIDIGKFNKHIDLAQSHGVHLVPRAADPRAGTPEIKAMGAPSLNIIDAGTGRTVAVLAGNDMTAKPMTMQRVYDEQKLVRFLADNRPDPRIASTVLSEALLAAGRSGKRVLAWFGEPDCPACEAWQQWFFDASVEQALAPGYVVIKIDPQRMANGRLVMDRITGKPGAPCPAVAVLSGEGKPVDPEALVEGLPATSEQRAAFGAMLARLGGAIDPAALETALAKLPDKPVVKPKPGPLATAPPPAPPPR